MLRQNKKSLWSIILVRETRQFGFGNYTWCSLIHSSLLYLQWKWSIFLSRSYSRFPDTVSCVSNHTASFFSWEAVHARKISTTYLDRHHDSLAGVDVITERLCREKSRANPQESTFSNKIDLSFKDGLSACRCCDTFRVGKIKSYSDRKSVV